jgi:allantoicase
MTSHVQEQAGVAVLGSGAGAAPGQDSTRLPDLASRSLGGSVVHTNDERFAERENLVEPEAPSYSTYTFGHEGQVYDGWETRRRREPGFHSAIVSLGAPGVVRGVVDTAFLTGNHPPEVSAEGAAVEGHPSPGELQDAEWVPLVPRAPAAGDTRNAFAVDQPQRFTHVRPCMHPDGGVARLRVHGEVVPDPRFLDPGTTAWSPPRATTSRPPGGPASTPRWR